METFQRKNIVLEIEHWRQVKGLTSGFTCKKDIAPKEQLRLSNLALHVGEPAKQVVENRHAVAKEIGIPLEQWVGSQQTHGSHIQKITHKEAGLGSVSYGDALKETDGLYTEETGILLTQFFADCVPIFFRHKASRLIGITHAGWKGTTLGIAGKMIQIWQSQEGIAASEIEVVIGPSICKDCYEVNSPVIQAVHELLGESASDTYQTNGTDCYQLDLKRVNQLLLLKNGVLPENIYITNYCTNCDHQTFFSYRKEKEQAGRMMGYIGWLENESSK